MRFAKCDVPMTRARSLVGLHQRAGRLTWIKANPSLGEDFVSLSIEEKNREPLHDFNDRNYSRRRARDV